MIELLRNFLIYRSRDQKSLLLILSDLFAYNITFIFSYIFFKLICDEICREVGNYPILALYSKYPLLNIFFLSLIAVIVTYLLNGYKSFFRSNPARSFIGYERLVGTILFCLIISILILIDSQDFVLSIAAGISLLINITFYFVLIRSLAYVVLSKQSDEKRTPILIYGAGQAGMETAASISLNEKFRILGFIDDNKKIKKFKILGYRVLGGISKVSKVKKEYPNLIVVMAMIKIPSTVRSKIISELEKEEIHVKTIPLNYGSLETKLSINNLDVNDLIKRDPHENEIDISDIKLDDTNILVTGAGGSIGSVISKKLSELKPQSLIFIDNSEFNLYKLEQSFKEFSNFKNMKFYLRDVTDEKSIEEIIQNEKVNMIYHAAAYKHVPLLQDYKNYSMALKNNFIATFNLCEIAYRNRLKSFTLISTDKAVNPTNIMGASKRLAELSLQGFQNKDNNKTSFSMVRFGNVLNSSGSVVPLFWDQINEGGPVTVTDENVNRFFMTIEEASSLVIQASFLARGGEVFLLDMGNPLKILDLAKRMIRLSGNSVAEKGSKKGIEIVFSGLRPGEKLYEELLLSSNPIKTNNPKISKGIEKSFPLDEIKSLKDKIGNLGNTIDYSNISSEISKYVDGY